jgi:NAD(P)H-hydrate repair Nnr-like enzyme with NAD(P)H-hydrate dehydratase domain
MAHLKQQPGKTLYPNIEWSKPENSNLMGNLLIVGGSAHSISAPSSAYQFAKEFGLSNIKVIVPEAAKKIIPVTLPFLEFAPANPSGSFNKEATNIIKAYANTSDCSLYCGNFGKNSETAILIEDVIQHTNRIAALCGDAIDFFIYEPNKILERPKTIVVASFAQLQKMAKNTPFTEAFLFSDSPQQIVQKLKNFMEDYNCILITEAQGIVILADNRNIITTNFNKTPSNWQIRSACLAGYWSMFNADNVFEACATAIAGLTD